MEKARQAVSDFMSKAGHHNTTVHETVAPAITHETVKPQRHENVTTAVDKETHQEHYHTSVQPVVDRKVLPEEHHHNLVPVEHREFHHNKDRDVEAKLAEVSGQFKDHQIVEPTRETKNVVPVVAGEHVHHHVHETIQPVVQRETIQPHVVHTTVPIHEVHHNDPKHHAVSSLPAVSMSDFKKQGGVLSGREERFDGFEGEPRHIGGQLSSHDRELAEKGHHQSHTGHGVAAGAVGTGAAVAAADKSHHHHDRHHNKDSATSLSSSDEEMRKHGSGKLRENASAGMTGAAMAGERSTAGSHGNNYGSKLDPRVNSDHNGSHSSTTGTGAMTDTQPKQKTGLLAKLNPKVDSDGDGKAGFLK